LGSHNLKLGPATSVYPLPIVRKQYLTTLIWRRPFQHNCSPSLLELTTWQLLFVVLASA